MTKEESFEERYKVIEVKPKRIRFSFGLTINLGNFESARLDADEETDILPHEGFDDALERLKEEVIPEVLATGLRMKDVLQDPQQRFDLAMKSKHHMGLKKKLTR